MATPHGRMATCLRNGWGVPEETPWFAFLVTLVKPPTRATQGREGFLCLTVRKHTVTVEGTWGQEHEHTGYTVYPGRK